MLTHYTMRSLTRPAAIAALALSALTAQADNLNPVLGGGLGAMAGAVIGQSVGGREGAVIGAAVGGMAGVTLATQGEHHDRPRHSVRGYEFEPVHDHGRRRWRERQHHGEREWEYRDRDERYGRGGRD